MTIRIGLIGGAGHIGYVLNGIRELGDAQLLAIASGCEEEDVIGVRSRAAAGAAVRTYPDYRRMLDHENLDIVTVSPYYYLHAEISCAALHRGIAVYSEKPLALTPASLEAVARARAASGSALGIMLNFRYLPAFHTARKLVESGAIGEATVGYSQKSYKRGNRPEFYRKRETFGGIIPWVGIHAVDWFRWVSGREYAAVSAHHTKLHRPDYPEMEDAATCLFELDNGGTAVMSFDFLRPAGAATHGDDRLRILGEKGAIEVRGEDWVELTTETGVEQIAGQRPAHGSFADFALSVVDPAHVCTVSAEDALRTTDVVLKARAAADGRKRLDIRPQPPTTP